MERRVICGEHTILGKQVTLGENVIIGHNCIIEDHVILGDHVYIDNNCIIRKGVSVGKDSTIGAGCIIGEHLMDFYEGKRDSFHSLIIGENALIRSGSIIYGDSQIGRSFQTGHRVTIRENTIIGNHVSIGTFSDIQGSCSIGNYVRLHSNVHVGKLSRIDDYVWIFPGVILTNDPTPPSDNLEGVHVKSFAVISASSVLLPGVEIESDSLVGAGAVVTKSVERYAVVVGNPAKKIADIRNIRNKGNGEPVYPWRYHFKRNMPWEKMGYEEWVKENFNVSDK